MSVDWGPIYTPRVPGAFMHSVALPERMLGVAWDTEGPALDSGGGWGNYAGTRTVLEEFHTERSGGWMRSRMRAPDGSWAWTRAVSLARLADALPVVAIQDSYAGEGAAGMKVFTLNLMADGPVQTPAGSDNAVLGINVVENLQTIKVRKHKFCFLYRSEESILSMLSYSLS